MPATDPVPADTTPQYEGTEIELLPVADSDDEYNLGILTQIAGRAFGTYSSVIVTDDDL